jgi:hypothetical protein
VFTPRPTAHVRRSADNVLVCIDHFGSAITKHTLEGPRANSLGKKWKGSEFPAVVIPLAMQQSMLLLRDLVYTDITRGKNLVVVMSTASSAAW